MEGQGDLHVWTLDESHTFNVKILSALEEGIAVDFSARHPPVSLVHPHGGSVRPRRPHDDLGLLLPFRVSSVEAPALVLGNAVGCAAADEDAVADVGADGAFQRQGEAGWVLGAVLLGQEIKGFNSSAGDGVLPTKNKQSVEAVG